MAAGKAKSLRFEVGKFSEENPDCRTAKLGEASSNIWMVLADSGQKTDLTY